MADYDFERLIKSIPDYPKPGVVFKDITPLLADPEGFEAVISGLADPYRSAGVTKVMGSEARGFMLGAPVALELGAGFVPARKPGKLPREVASQEYDLEYGTPSCKCIATRLARATRSSSSTTLWLRGALWKRR